MASRLKIGKTITANTTHENDGNYYEVGIHISIIISREDGSHIYYLVNSSLSMLIKSLARGV